MGNRPVGKNSFIESINRKEKHREDLFRNRIIALVGLIILFTCGSFAFREVQKRIINSRIPSIVISGEKLALSEIPDYTGSPYIIVNNSVPSFNIDETDLSQAMEYYSDLDYLGRCGPAFANLCRELEPMGERGSISEIYPTGWNNQIYNGIDQGYLYNRCHLIGFQLTGENDNERNLITGTRYFNIEGMLPFETQIRQYIDETNNHVLYRVTPLFEGNNLVADGVQLEAWSVEDSGKEVCLNVFVYNVQPGIDIDYSNGDSRIKDA